MDLAIYHDSINNNNPLLLVDLEQYLKNFPIPSVHEAIVWNLDCAHVKQHPVNTIDNQQSHNYGRTVCPSIIEPYVAQEKEIVILPAQIMLR